MNDPATVTVGVAHTLTGLIAVAEGAVVSRTLIDRQRGTVTLFAFDQGQGLSEHSAPFDALVQVFDGVLTITLDGTAHTVTAGQVLVMPADIPHALHALEPTRMLLTMIRDQTPRG